MRFILNGFGLMWWGASGGREWAGKDWPVAEMRRTCGWKIPLFKVGKVWYDAAARIPSASYL